MSTDTTRPETTASSRDSNIWGLYTFLGGISTTILLVGSGLGYAYFAQRAAHEEAATAQLQRLIQDGILVVQKTDSPLEEPDPFALAWADAPVRTVALLPQNLTMPAIQQVSVPEVELQAMWDGRHIAFRLTWPDATADRNVDTARFTDAVAIQFPLERSSSFMMGGQQSPVQIIQWKALWQKDVDEHFQDVQDVHPNYWADFYWFARPLDQHAGQGSPYRVPQSFEDPMSHQWFTAHQARNPEAVFHRDQPVQEMLAEGFGSLLTQKQAVSRGRGVWKDGRWHVVFSRLMSTDDQEDFQFRPGSQTRIGVAVWDGSVQNVGGRKQYADWIPLQVMP